MTIIIFILVLLVCVIAHEWGHFIVAKKSGMLVEEFGFGIPPRLFSWKRGETTYSINALPIGGFVKIAGENGEDKTIPFNRQFESKPWYVKSAVLIAGVVMNIILAFVLFTAAYTIGMPTITDTGTPTVITVVSGGAAEKAGLAAGDTVTKVLVGTTPEPVLTTDGLHAAIAPSSEPVTIFYTHGGVSKTAVLTPVQENGSSVIGIAIEPIGNVKVPFFTAMKNAVLQIRNITISIWQTLSGLVGGLFNHTASTSGLMGPVGLAKEVGNAATIGFTYLLAFTAAISINLAVLNIMPFPALDGGRLLVVLLERICNRKFSATTVGIIHTVGFLILLGLMVVLTVGDIRKLL